MNQIINLTMGFTQKISQFLQSNPQPHELGFWVMAFIGSMLYLSAMVVCYKLFMK